MHLFPVAFPPCHNEFVLLHYGSDVLERAEPSLSADTFYYSLHFILSIAAVSGLVGGTSGMAE